jgi:hypothetical protein
MEDERREGEKGGEGKGGGGREREGEDGKDREGKGNSSAACEVLLLPLIIQLHFIFWYSVTVYYIEKLFVFKLCG